MTAGYSATLCAPLGVTRTRAAERISFVSFGGSYGDFVKEHWIRPFTAETGIEVEYVTGPDLARAKAQVTSNNIGWDIFDSAGSTILAGSRENLWEPINRRIVDASHFVVPIGPDRMPSFIYSGGIAWNTQRNQNAPKSFAELWDPERFPGRRALRTRVSETLELALLADGVPPSQLYPLDVDRGFRALERIKPHVRNWFDQTTQGITLIQTGEADFSYTYANRIRAARESGIPLDFSFDQTINAVNYFTVLRGSPRKEAAMRFLNFIAQPRQQGLMAERVGFAAVVPVEVSEGARRWLPDFTNPRSIRIDDEYWQDRFVALDRRFKEWILT